MPFFFTCETRTSGNSASKCTWEKKPTSPIKAPALSNPIGTSHHGAWGVPSNGAKTMACRSALDSLDLGPAKQGFHIGLDRRRNPLLRVRRATFPLVRRLAHLGETLGILVAQAHLHRGANLLKSAHAVRSKRYPASVPHWRTSLLRKARQHIAQTNTDPPLGQPWPAPCAVEHSHVFYPLIDCKDGKCAHFAFTLAKY
jgi:hypothetical protein